MELPEDADAGLPRGGLCAYAREELREGDGVVVDHGLVVALVADD